MDARYSAADVSASVEGPRLNRIRGCKMVLIHHSFCISTSGILLYGRDFHFYLLLSFFFFLLKLKFFVLAGVAQLVGCCPSNRKVESLIPGQDTCLGYGPGPRWGAYKRQVVSVSSPLFLHPFPSL